MALAGWDPQDDAKKRAPVRCSLSGREFPESGTQSIGLYWHHPTILCWRYLTQYYPHTTGDRLSKCESYVASQKT